MELNTTRVKAISESLVEVDMEDGQLERIERKLSNAVRTIACLIAMLEDKGSLEPADTDVVVSKAKEWWIV